MYRERTVEKPRSNIAAIARRELQDSAIAAGVRQIGFDE